MILQIVILSLSVLISGLSVWCISSNYFQKKIESLKEENLTLKNQTSLNDNFINELKLSFLTLAQEAIKNQQESLLNEHSNNLKSKMELFKAEELTPLNKLIQEFKYSIENYQKSHENNTLEIKNAISTAEKYAKALTQNQNSKGEFGEQWLEQILKFANLIENVHYKKQYSTSDAKPDFVINLPNDKNIIIDSKVILKNYIEYCENDYDKEHKKKFLSDLTECINSLAKKNYEEIEDLTQPGFILMFIPIEACVNLIYTDYDFRKIIELANLKNIIIVGTSSLIVTMRLINQLWASQTQYDNIQNIIETGENLYKNLSLHAQNLINIKQIIEKASNNINTEINRITTRNNGSIFKEAERLRQYGISAKETKTKSKIIEKSIPEELLN